MLAEMIAGPATQLVVDCTNFDAIFQAANRAAWIAVADDPVLNAGLSAASVQFVNISKAVLSNCDVLCSCTTSVATTRADVTHPSHKFCQTCQRDVYAKNWARHTHAHTAHPHALPTTGRPSSTQFYTFSSLYKQPFTFEHSSSLL